jgi:hypothetical protein
MSWAIEHKSMICWVARTVQRRAAAAGVALELDDLIQDGALPLSKRNVFMMRVRGRGHQPIFIALFFGT